MSAVKASKQQGRATPKLQLHSGHRPRSTASRVLRIVPALLSITACVLLWEICYRLETVNLTFFPPPSKFLPYLLQENFTLGLGPERTNVALAVLLSFLRVIAGLAIAFTAAVATGICISLIPYASLAALPLVRLLAPIAPIAWIPLALALFGLGNASAVFLVFMGTYFILIIATVASIQQVDNRLLETAATLGATAAERWYAVILPAALPQVFTMLRINFIGAWMAVLAAEMVGLHSGLGALILLGRESSNPDLILIGMTLIGIAGFVIDQLLLAIQKRCLWWQTEKF